ncbi:hypothetical protein HYU22_02105 [Candidatus Woesearchaeota archaeon]|nr:hypothetical protein [Candidatus Woesearchaeota archaeon]
MGTGCSECERVIPDEMGYASLFHAGTYTGTLEDVILPKRAEGSSFDWTSFPPNANICREDVVRLPRETLKEIPPYGSQKIYGLQSDSIDVLSYLFSRHESDVKGETYNRLKDTFRFLSEDNAKTYFPKAVLRVEAESVAKNKRSEEESRLVKVLDYIGGRLDINIKYSDPHCIPTFREELLQEPKEGHGAVALAFNAFDGTFTVGQYENYPHVHLEYSRQLGGPGDFLQAGVATVIAEKTVGKVRGIKFLVASGLHEGKVTGIYRKSSCFRHLQAPTIWVYSRARGNTGINRFLEGVQEFAAAVSSDKVNPLTANVQDFLRRQLKK